MKARKALEREIEQLRNEMYQAFEKKGNDEEVVKISQKLDKVLNQLR